MGPIGIGPGIGAKLPPIPALKLQAPASALEQTTQTLTPTPAQKQPDGGATGAASAFSNLLHDAVGQIDQLQKGADKNIAKLAAGQPVDLHEVTIGLEQASLAFQLGLQVRNKLVEAYQEVMRMQV